MNKRLKEQYVAARLVFDSEVAKIITDNPTRTYSQLVMDHAISLSSIIRATKVYGINRTRGRKPGSSKKVGA